MSKKYLILPLLLSYFFVSPSSAFALTVPNFPSCSNPEGTVIANYETGDHGIPGYPGATFTGKDTVFSLSGTDTVMQCFCSTKGDGIQTNWWNVSSLDHDQMEVLKADHWNFVPTGAVWGLADDPYMTRNFDYLCRPFELGGAPVGGGGVGGPSGSILASAASTSIGGESVLGLASTGNMPFIAAVLTAGCVSLGFGLLLKRRSN